MTSLDPLVMCRRIGVYSPYFAFLGLHLQEDLAVRGTVYPEQPREFELGALTAAEIGRHLAILGACAAAAQKGEETIHYLATKANYRRVREEPESSSDAPLVATAKVTHMGKRDLKVDATIADKSPIAELQVEYQIVSEPLFLRMFGRHQIEVAPQMESPYSRLLPLRLVELNGERIKMEAGTIDPSQCAGHFPNFPAWPVALIMHCLCRTGAALLHTLVGRSANYTITEAKVGAETLAFWTEPLSFHASVDPTQTRAPHYCFDCEARRGEDLIATLKVVFRAESR